MRKLFASFIALITIITFGFTGTKNVNAASDGVTDFVTRLYKVCLDRDPDKDGLNMWVNLLKSEESTGCAVSYGFVFSPEFQGKKCSNTEYVTYMYKAFFDRLPDPEGLNTWVGLLDSGASREFIFCGFANSVEFSNLCKSFGVIRGYHIEGTDFIKTGQVNLFVYRLYKEILDRPADDFEIESWSRALVSGQMTGSQVAYEFVFSNEFTSKKLCNRHYVDVLYKAFLGRAATTAEKDSLLYSMELNSQNRATRLAVFNGVITSQEFVKSCQTCGINPGTRINVKELAQPDGFCPLCHRLTINGRTQIGLKEYGGKTYYFGDDGIPVKGWKSLDDNGNKYWFYFDDDYTAHMGWLTYKDKTYFFNEKYHMVTGRNTIRTKTYMFDSKDGHMITGWFSEGSCWYYADEDGSLHYGWLLDKGDYYYLDENLYGRAVEGERLIKGDYYYFEYDTCKCKTGWVNSHYYDPKTYKKVMSGWVSDSGKWYYIKPDDQYRAREIYTIKGQQYYFDKETGELWTGWHYTEHDGNWHYFDKDGIPAIGWTKIGDKWYYFAEDSWYLNRMWTGFLTWQGDKYYLDEKNGNMLTGFQTISDYGDITYETYFDSKGRQATVGWYYIDGVPYFFRGYYYSAVLQKDTFIWDTPLNGRTGLYGLDENGRIRTGWYEDDYSNVYYFSPDTYNALDDGWNKIGPNWHYFYQNGVLAVNCTIDGYKIGSNGIAYDHPD